MRYSFKSCCPGVNGNSQRGVLRHKCLDLYYGKPNISFSAPFFLRALQESSVWRLFQRLISAAGDTRVST